MMSWLYFKIIQAWEWEEAWVGVLSKQDWPRLVTVEIGLCGCGVNSAILSTFVYMV